MHSQINTICKSVNFHIRSINNVASSPLRLATTSLEDWSFPALMPTLFFLARARLTLLVYNACKTRLRGWSCLADVTSPPLTCSGSYTGSVKQMNHLQTHVVYLQSFKWYGSLLHFAMVHLQNTDPAEYRQRLRSSSDQTRLIVSRSFKRAGWALPPGGYSHVKAYGDVPPKWVTFSAILRHGPHFGQENP